MQRKPELNDKDRPGDPEGIDPSGGLAAPVSGERGESPHAVVEAAAGTPAARVRPNRARRVRTLVITLLLAPMLLVVAAFGMDRLMRRGEILRGVMVCGVKLGGLDRAGASRALREIADRARDEPFPVRVATRPFELVPQSIGYSLDVEQTLARALAAGRDGNALAQLGWWMGRWFRPRRVAPVATLDEARLEQSVLKWEAESIEDRPFEGALRAQGLDIVPDYPRRGRGVVRDGLAARMLDAIALGGGEPLELPLGEVSPRREREAVDRAAQEASKLTAGPVVLTAMLVPQQDGPSAPPLEGGSKPATQRDGASKAAAGESSEEALEPVDVSFGRQQLLEALRARPAAGNELELEPYLDAEAIGRFLTDVRARIEQPPRDASFAIDKHDHVRIVPGAAGTLLDAAKVTEAVLAAARTPDRRGPLPIERGARPKLDTEQARALGITKLVGQFTTQHPCCQPRVENIHRIADVVDGTLVLPGETISLNTLAGQRTKAAGYVGAPAIEEGEMVDAIGGGVSQFATTLFNVAFRAGYDVPERAPHSFYFRRYPMGLDATLSFPKPDLVIRNDTQAGLLIKTTHTKTSITVKFYGDTGARRVEWTKSAPFDLVTPPIKYLPNPDRDPETEKVKYSGQVGWSVYVSRTVTLAGGEPKKERRKVTYKPRARELEVHPCQIPKGEDGYTGLPCPKPEEPAETEEPEEPNGSKDATGVSGAKEAKGSKNSKGSKGSSKGGKDSTATDTDVLGPPEVQMRDGSAEELIPPSLLTED